MPDQVTIARRSRIAYLSYSTAEFDSRTGRMATSAQGAGHEVIVYARWEPGLPLEDASSGIRLVRVPTNLALAIPGLRWLGRRRPFILGGGLLSALLLALTPAIARVRESRVTVDGAVYAKDRTVAEDGKALLFGNGTAASRRAQPDIPVGKGLPV